MLFSLDFVVQSFLGLVVVGSISTHSFGFTQGRLLTKNVKDGGNPHRGGIDGSTPRNSRLRARLTLALNLRFSVSRGYLKRNLVLCSFSLCREASGMITPKLPELYGA